ncbi:hypothetical protein, conserved [Babesia bigemina]|uniref:Uncharacterized protein n=1 Tax=Babesia bigemina TaxID=5866 RepID=A0A061D5N5_BABBI|nr:hypothetical protein, conserved [Babesia bigemina]CDR95307.1 hypothetical protein, conserved [Babesia bigemina]|eukprot:XP_012767493.1 hypothetical protein, conserved [Babesia bigemina]
MPTWALSSASSFYRHVLLEDVSRSGGTNDPERVRDWFLRYVLEPDPLTVSVTYDDPRGDNDAQSAHRDLAAIAHVGNSSVSARVAAFHGSSGLCRNGLYCMPYESTFYLNQERSHLNFNELNHSSFYDLMQCEIVNGMAPMYTWGRKRVMLLKPTGAANGGIEAVEVMARSAEGSIELETNVRFKVYPSGIFYPKRRAKYREVNAEASDAESEGSNSDSSESDGDSSGDEGHQQTSQEPSWRIKMPFERHVNPQRGMFEAAYDFSNGYFTPYVDTEPTVTGDTERPYPHHLYRSWKNVSSRDSHILELRASANIIYARSFNGFYVGRCIEEGRDWRVDTLNNQQYGDRDKVYFMHPNPFIPSECAMLASNTLLLYDASQSKERKHLTLQLPTCEGQTVTDVVHTVAFGMNMNELILGGDHLYILDMRTDKIEELLVKPNKEIRVTSTRWTERLYEPTTTANRSLAGASCAGSNYWRNAKPSFWDAFTAIAVHPVYRHIMACVCGRSNAIYIWDLRVPIKPVLEIPLPAAEYLGARFRELIWSASEESNGESTLVAFSWRQRHPITCRFRINRTITRFVQDTGPAKERQFWNGWMDLYDPVKQKQLDRLRGVRPCKLAKAEAGRPPRIARVGPVPKQKPVPQNMHYYMYGMPIHRYEEEDDLQQNEAPDDGAADNEDSALADSRLLSDFASGKVFANDLELTLIGVRPMQVMRVSKGDLEANMDSVGPLIESPEDYPNMIFKAPQHEVAVSIFHGYCGVAVVWCGNEKLLFACTTSGSIFAMDLQMRRQVRCPVASRSNNAAKTTSKGGELFRYVRRIQGSVKLPREFITDEVRWIVLHPNTSEVKTPPIPIAVLGLSKRFVEMQETDHLPLSCGENTFDSRSLLQWLTKQQIGAASGLRKHDIMSLQDFEDHIGSRTHLEHLATNVWDCNDMKIDFEYDAVNVNNKYLDPTPPCHCFTSTNADHGCEILSSYIKALKVNEDGEVTVEPLHDVQEASQSNKGGCSTMEDCLSRAAASVSKQSIGVEADGIIHAREIANTVLFHSPVLPEINGASDVPPEPPNEDDGVHHRFCGVGHLIAIKLREEHTDDKNERIEQLLGSWRTSADTGGGTMGAGITRFHKQSNQVELLRRSQMERDHLVQQLLLQSRN